MKALLQIALGIIAAIGGIAIILGYLFDTTFSLMVLVGAGGLILIIRLDRKSVV